MSERKSDLVAVAPLFVGLGIVVVGGLFVGIYLSQGERLVGPKSYLVDNQPDLTVVKPTQARAPDRIEPAPNDEAPPSDAADAAETGPAAGTDAPSGAAHTAVPRPRGMAVAAPGSDAPLEGQELADAIRDEAGGLLGDIEACVQGWNDAGLPADGKLVVELQLGPAGLEDAAITQVEDVPGPVTTCFGTVLYDASWPAATEPTTVRYPFDITSE